MSVVQIASAKDGKPSSCSASYQRVPDSNTSMGSGAPITPVLQTCTSMGWHPVTFAAIAAIGRHRLLEGPVRIRIATIDHDDLGQMAIDRRALLCTTVPPRSGWWSAPAHATGPSATNRPRSGFHSFSPHSESPTNETLGCASSDSVDDSAERPVRWPVQLRGISGPASCWRGVSLVESSSTSCISCLPHQQGRYDNLRTLATHSTNGAPHLAT